MKRLAAALSLFAVSGVVHADKVFFDDVIVDGSECIGNDCTNGESFGFDTLRLKENNLRIKFQDTSVGSFPSNDWQLRANDSTNGGDNFFAIDDITGGKTPFAIQAGARDNALYIENTGDVGIGTSQPVLQLQVSDGNTPGLRLEQNGSAGFTPQTWDIAGNEANFFVRDVTNGSRLPFRIEPSAPTSSLYIESDGDIGMGTSSPDTPLHIRRTSGEDATIKVENAQSTVGLRKTLDLRNNGTVEMAMRDTSSNPTETWVFSVSESSGFSISRVGSGTLEFTVTPGGDVEVGGSIVHSSSRTLKEQIAEVDARSVLDKVMQMPISSWSYKKDNGKISHIGPMAEDFYEAFGLGSDNKHIASMDIAGVALASTKELQKQNRKLKKENLALQNEIQEIRKLDEKQHKKLSEIEKRLEELSGEM